jgi:hypothetical protein
MSECELETDRSPAPRRRVLEQYNSDLPVGRLAPPSDWIAVAVYAATREPMSGCNIPVQPSLLSVNHVSSLQTLKFMLDGQLHLL